METNEKSSSLNKKNHLKKIGLGLLIMLLIVFYVLSFQFLNS